MRLSVLGVCFFLVLFACLEGRNNKDDWRHKKLKHLSKFGGSSKDGGVENVNIEKTVNGLLKPPMPGGDFNQKKFNRKMKNKYLKKKKHGNKKHHKKMSWLKIDSDNDCDQECKPGEVCVSGPVDKRPLCVDKRDLKKSVKLFHRYHKKELKSWKKFHKKSYKKKSKWQRKQEKHERKKNSDIMALKKHYMKMHGHKEHFDKDFDKHAKHTHFDGLKKEHDLKNKYDKMDMKEHDYEELMKQEFAEHAKYKGIEMSKNKPDDKAAFLPKPDENECTASEFAQMRTRMMGWFHLLHGQDHLARKAHGGSIAKFYKHVSVKKELREHDGMKCGCLKSAMWQFHQLDKNVDDHLTPSELAVVEENSLEPCMKPYLRTCDRNGDDKLSSDEWCCCFSHVVAPCLRRVDEIKKAGDKDAFIPRCDREGYYMREQCKSDANDDLLCWCVDINGNELKGTYTKGRAHCSKLAMLDIKNTPFF